MVSARKLVKNIQINIDINYRIIQTIILRKYKLYKTERERESAESWEQISNKSFNCYS